ncbi:LPS export ABC transporter permease LptF [Sediminicoccus rosea]|jgi:lipopolysaccharide export system permease protein|uniref:LPS export ABC transporter permease LptF n=1 Tax=Sediminicoccus rosea TaxID=1225128 RepID=A0ABZ0PG18_9PROT|nr:LPS export ABC transporter permease LptF [Sediminicoccus rosea]WPB84663.1 LPS export ABC transporter permease LptF [Sediminicoccus rosea]
MKRIDLYIMRQLALSLLAVTVGLAALVWLTQSLRFIELVLDRGLSIWVFLELTGLLLPSFFGVILPITTFVVTLFTYVRLASDRELVVMRAAGLSQWQLARPALLVAMGAMGICFILNLWLTPASHQAFREWQFEIRNQMAGLLLQEGVFSSVGEELTVYARDRDSSGTLYGILVHDSRERGAPVTILAESGRIVSTPQGPRVTLFNGQRQQVERVMQPDGSSTLRLTVLTFQENSLDLARANRSEGQRFRNAQERTMGELLNPEEGVSVRDRRRFLAEAHQRLTGPLTAVTFALLALAVALSGQFRRFGGGINLFIGSLLMVGLLALGLSIGNLAARQSALIPLIWLHALLPGFASAWVISGMPGLPDQMRGFAR